MSASPNTAQTAEIDYITGVDASGRVVAQSFATWNDDDPATYKTGSLYVGRWGGGRTGNGASLTYSFDAASGWTSTEQAAFKAAFSLYAAETGLSFAEVSGSASISITRSSNGQATGGTSLRGSTSVGSSTLSTITAGRVQIDTSVPSFGPIGSTFANYGGYPWTVVFHEIGHTLGLGHGGAYDGSGTQDAQTAYDSHAYTVMSYIDADEGAVAAGAPAGGFSWGVNRSDNGSYYGGSPTTPMQLDILALQRLYGLPTSTPLSGGQVYGFNSNIDASIRSFFDFTVNTRPIVTLWNAGGGNTLDLSGYSTASVVDLHDGAFSSVAGLTNNVAIAFGTRIDGAIGGSGADRLVANDNSDTISGGGGADVIAGGAGNDHLYGHSANGGGDGNDAITGGAGGDYIQGNAGADTLSGGDGNDRINGGADNDTIAGDAGDDVINGNRGADSIDGGDGQDMLRGGQDNDQIAGNAGNDQLSGDLGDDVLTGGTGIDVLTGGDGADRFVFAAGDAALGTGSLAGFVDGITDFAHGADRIQLDFVPTTVLHGGADGFDAALAQAAQLLQQTGAVREAVAIAVGGDTLLFYGSGGADAVDSGIRLMGVAAATVTTADFV